MPSTARFIDLHTHSTASDGKLSPGELVRAAGKLELAALALTDHDTTGGLEEAAAEARKYGIRFIPGAELDIDRKSVPGFAISGEFHLLALGLRSPSESFKRELLKTNEARRERNLRIIERMRDNGWDADYAEVCEIAGQGSVGRPHFAEYLVKLKAARTIRQAFDRYLGHGKSLYIPRVGIDYMIALSVIKESGALAVLAHPASLYVSWGKLPELAAHLVSTGLDGIETRHPSATVHTARKLEALAQSLGLYMSAGSDYHGENRRDRRLGRASGGEKIPLSVLEAIPLLNRGTF